MKLQFKSSFAALVGTAAALFLSACSSDERMTMTMEERLQASLPEPPPILSVPVLTLFTNQPGFGARCRIERGTGTKPLEGELVHRGSQFLFSAEAQEKHARGREMTFTWNVENNNGHVLNDALPGYAPLMARSQLVTVQSTGKAPANDKIDGHPCTQEQLTVNLSDGTSSQISVWRATDLRGFPVRLRADSGNPRFLINLTEIRFQEPSMALFDIPADFTKYENPKAMFDELFRRESLARRDNKVAPAFDEEAFQKSGVMRQY